MPDDRDWSELTRREKDQRRIDAHNAGVRDLMNHEGLSEREAKRKQEKISNQSWSDYQRSDGHK